jgi:hypothetical protein
MTPMTKHPNDDVRLSPKYSMIHGSPADQMVVTHRTGQEETVVIYLVGESAQSVTSNHSCSSVARERSSLNRWSFQRSSRSALLTIYDWQEQRTHK